MVETIQRMFVTLLSVALLAPAAFAEDADVANGEALFKTCVPCHGDTGGGLSLDDRDGVIYLAPSIAGLPQWYVDGQLIQFQKGERGAHAGDTQGLRMRPMSRALTVPGEPERSERLRVNVSAYIASLPTVAPPKTVDGDPERGKVLYTPCISCHGPEAQGNEAVKGPPLAHLNDWYVVNSLEKYKSGMRGGDQANQYGKIMRAMSMTLATDEAIRDVASYLRTLGN